MTAKKPKPAAADPRKGGKTQPPAASKAAPAAAPAAPSSAERLHDGPEPSSTAARRRIVVDEERTVTVTVPKAFKLQHPAGIITDYAAGVCEMPESHADHVYSKANGVTRYEK